MAWPGAGAELDLRSFARSGPGGALKVAGVSLLGSDAEVEWEASPDGLRITAPAAAPNQLAVTYKIALAEED